MSRHGTIHWTELNTRDPDKAKAFYGAIMGWTFVEAPTAGTDNARPYFIAMKGDAPVAGVFTLAGPEFDGVPEHWFTYIAVADLAKSVAETRAGGGRICRDPFPIPGFGTLAIVADANGGVFGMIEPV